MTDEECFAKLAVEDLEMGEALFGAIAAAIAKGGLGAGFRHMSHTVARHFEGACRDLAKKKRDGIAL